MKPIIHLSIFFLLLFGGHSLQGQHFLRAQGRAIVNENQDTILLRGMGLGGWMVQEGYMLQTAGFANPQHEIRATIEALIGETATDQFYDAWLANHFRKADMDSLKAWGFNSVRLPMHYNLFTLPIEDEPIPGQQTWLDKGFELTDSVISWCAQNEMYVILDLHAAPGGQGYDAGISDYDETKPSLWESKANRDKMVALWKKLAERYVDEQWVAGYDLLNEPNWDLPGNAMLRQLYVECTDSIRTVDTTHMIFIEGNWFANDFTGLTPPWDDNLVYSPHKYWSNNDVATMQWVIDLRNTHNVPLYLGESGENSNVWFRDAIRLLEDLDIGWAWWPLKKIESISCPLSVEKSEAYQTLLDYWSGNGPQPTVEFATNALMDLTESLKAENCDFQPDVVDAMFRQVYSDETVPYGAPHSIPGVIHATDYDMGVNGSAYYDTGTANYHVSTGNYTPWNNGWIYRNDGVDIEPSEDNVASNGYNVGFVDSGEWMQYEVEVTENGVYDIRVRTASDGAGGRLYFTANGSNITPVVAVPSTGGWQNWQTVTIPDVILDTTDRKIRFYIETPEFNLGSFEFVKTAKASSDVPTGFRGAVTRDEYSIQLDVNKPLNSDLPVSPAGFDVRVNGSSVPVNAVSFHPDKPRSLIIEVDYTLKSTEEIDVSYSGSAVLASDGTPLNSFSQEDVINTLRFVHQLPGRVEAEDYDFQIGTSLEDCSDTGGGQNLAYLDPGDYLEYEINITEAGPYQISYRNASEWGSGGLELLIIDSNGQSTLINSASFSPTGGWQLWNTQQETATLPAGRYTLRIYITAAPFNLNWVEFASATSQIDLPGEFRSLQVYPNPSADTFTLNTQLHSPQDIQIEVFDVTGKSVYREELSHVNQVTEQIDLFGQPAGIYYLALTLQNGTTFTQKLIQTGR